MKKPVTVVYILQIRLTDYCLRKYGCVELSQKGFDVHVLDLSLLLNKDVFMSKAHHYTNTAIKVHTVTSYKGLKTFIDEYSNEAIFIDDLCGLSGIDFKNIRLFRYLRKYGARYFIIAGGTLPVLSVFKQHSVGSNGLVQRLRPLTDASRWMRFLSTRSIILIQRIFHSFAMPEKILSLDTDVLSGYLSKYNLDRSKVIPIHSLDFNIYLDYMKKTGHSPVTPENICVFIDEAVIHSDDVDILGIKRLEADKYFKSMCRLFDIVEKQTGLRVVIASHPDSLYENMPSAFGPREIIKGNTIDLVSKSSFIIMHSSTSVSFAVLFRKPLLIVKTSGMLESGMSNQVDAMANALGRAAVNIDDEKELGNVSFKFTEWSVQSYDNYRSKYVKSLNLPDVSVWDVLSDEIWNK